MTALPFTFQHWPAGVVAAAACVALVAIAAKRRPAVPRATLVLAGFGAVLIALGASGLVWLRPATQSIAVFVDLSASTRTADFRGLDSIAKRQGQLIGDAATQPITFGERVEPLPSFDKPFMQDFDGKRTILPASDSPAILLFSDGRFTDAPRALPPVYAVLDPALERAKDAAVTSLEARGDTVMIGVRNTGDAPRALELHGVMPAGVISVQPGSYTLVRKLSPGAESISATFAPGDRWPENDSMRTWPPPAATVQRWWVVGRDGVTTQDASWQARSPTQLPTDSAAYVGTGAIVLDDVPADALDDARRAALDRYVRELGGALIILGGEHAFAVGGYAGTTLDTLSPLASTPPEPTTHWVLLADASGSMNQDAGGGGRTRWSYAADALATVMKQLPPADLASIGSFADDVRWWSRGKSVTETLKLPLPPADVGPRGATNLEAALQAVAAAPTEAKLPTQLLVATDAQTTIANADSLSAQLKTRGITLHLLLIGDPAQATGLAALQSIIAATGGTSRIERLPENWAPAIRELARAAEPWRIERVATNVRFLDPFVSMPPVQVSPWNRTWRKSDATPLAETTVRDERITMAARWNVGEGQVGAIAFNPALNVIEATVKLLERPPRDPRFRVSVDQASTLRVTIDATDGNTYLNGEHLTLEFTSDGAVAKAGVLPVPQTAPGRYELATYAPPGGIARIRRDGRQTLDTFALPVRYAPEFDAVGNDRAALAELARRTGGRLIEPGDTRRLELPFPRRVVPLAPWLATVGAALVCAGLVRWRVGT
jgi:hypothetical protein